MQVVTQMQTGVTVTKISESQIHAQSNLQSNADALSQWRTKMSSVKANYQLKGLYEPPESVSLELTVENQALKPLP